MPLLGVNIDHIATLRQVRAGVDPEPVFAAFLAQAGGADSLVVHLREDRRHIRERDLFLLKEAVRMKLNLEMSVADDIVAIACKVRPEQATLVPERRQEVTTEGGLDVVSGARRLRQVIARLGGQGIETSLFIDPDRRQIDAAKRLGVKMIELHTGRYASAKDVKERERFLTQLATAARYARQKRMHVFAGHGLDYHNVTAVARLPEIEEFNIGYSIVCRAVLVGLERAVKEMKALIE